MKLDAYDVIIRPIITEKSSAAMERNQYVFEVHPKANKIQIKEAVEKAFKVKVEWVNTINVKPKPRRLGIFRGRTKAWKKAIVKVADGQKIAFFEGAGA